MRARAGGGIRYPVDMFDEPNEEPHERSVSPAGPAREKSDEFRMHAELAAVFEGCRKFDARIMPLGGTAAQEVQQTMGKLEKAKAVEHPILPNRFGRTRRDC